MPNQRKPWPAPRPNAAVLYGDVFLVAGLAMAGVGLLVDQVLLMVLGSLIYSVNYWVRDCFGNDRTGISAMTVYAVLISTWMSISHLLALLFHGTAYNNLFFTYALPEYIVTAQKLATIMAIVPLLAGRLILNRKRSSRRSPSTLPEVGFETSPRATIVYCTVLLSLAWATRLSGQGILVGLGSIGYVVAYGPYLAFFILTYQWLGPQSRMPRNTMIVVVLLAIVDFVYAFSYSFMRGPLVYPFFSIFLAYFLRRKMFEPRVLTVACLVLGGLTAIYRPLGAIRHERLEGQVHATSP